MDLRDEDEITELIGDLPDDIFYEYVPSDMDLQDKKRLKKAVCRGCERQFGIKDKEDIKGFIYHCLKKCSNYEFLSISVHCTLCNRQGMDVQSLTKHVEVHHNKRRGGKKVTVVSLEEDRDCSDDEIMDVNPVEKEGKRTETKSDTNEEKQLKTTIDFVDDEEEVSAPKKEKKVKKEPPALSFTSSNGTTNLDLCNDYIPDTRSGDVVKWKGSNKFSILKTVCKGCGKTFPEESGQENQEKTKFTDSVLNKYISHCIRECFEYQSLGLVRYCYPCNQYCVDQEAFLEHMESTKSCPAYNCLNFKKTAGKSSQSSNGNNKKN